MLIGKIANLCKKFQMRRTPGTTILFISHYLEEAECICDTVAMMDGGKIVLQGNPRTLTDSEPGCKNLEALYFKLTGKQMRDSYE